MFTNSKDKKKVSLSVGKIITQLQKTKDGKVITNPALTQQSDWDIMRNDIREHVQLKIAAHIKTPNSGAINDALVRQWSTEAWKEVSSQLELTGSEGAFGFGDTRTARYKPTEIKIDPKIQTQLDNFKAYLNSPVFLVGTKQQQQGIINTFKRKYPTVADQIFYNPGVVEGEEESTLADRMQKSLIDPVTLIPTPVPSPAPAPTPAPSLLEPTAELTDSEIIANSLKGTGRNPLEVIRDNKIRNLEKAVTRMKAGKPNIGTSSSAVVRWLKNTKDTDYYKLSTEERIASTEEYIETLKS
jgi:hypothetical protein